jgi:hypothetical protein
MRACTIEKGFFTVQDIQQSAQVPRSTAQDWITRLLKEGCISLKEEKHGRVPAKYLSRSAIPQSICRRIFTAVDGDQVEIVHECLSSACAAFCGYHHQMGAKGMITFLQDGTILREFLPLGEYSTPVGLYPNPAVAITSLRREGNHIIQQIRSIGGPSFSLTEMMGLAAGVIRVETQRTGEYTEGKIRTRALTHLVIGIDDTDGTDQGATFALAIALLHHLGSVKGVFPICHYIAMLYPNHSIKTAGNSCSGIELAIEPELYDQILSEAARFVSGESTSPEWGVAIRKGFFIPEDLRQLGCDARIRSISSEETRRCAEKFQVSLAGGMGVTGALAAVALSGLKRDYLLNPAK